jgi:hypothetical protein
MLRGMPNVRARALFWLIYDRGLHCKEALATNLEDVDWTRCAVRPQGKGNPLLMGRLIGIRTSSLPRLIWSLLVGQSSSSSWRAQQGVTHAELAYLNANRISVNNAKYGQGA